MGDVLLKRLGAKRSLPLGEQALLALSVAAGELGSKLESILKTHGLTRTRYAVLRMLRAAGTEGLAQGEIGDRLLVPSPDVTRLVNPLADSGLIERNRSPGDRRIVRHVLTKDGERLLAKIEPQLERQYRRIEESLGAQACRKIVEVCEQVVRAQDHD